MRFVNIKVRQRHTAYVVNHSSGKEKEKKLQTKVKITAGKRIELSQLSTETVEKSFEIVRFAWLGSENVNFRLALANISLRA